MNQPQDMTKRNPATVEVFYCHISIGWIHYTDKNSYIFYPNPSYNLRSQPCYSLSLYEGKETPEAKAFRKVSKQTLPPLFANLLPDGLRLKLAQTTLRKQGLKQNDLNLLRILSKDLPGQFSLKQTSRQEIIIDPTLIKQKKDICPPEHIPKLPPCFQHQMTLSALKKGTRFVLPTKQDEANYQIRLPVKTFPFISEIEFAAFTLADKAGLFVSPSQLVRLEDIPVKVSVPQQSYTPQAIAIARQDISSRHVENFCQVLDIFNYTEKAPEHIAQIYNILHHHTPTPDRLFSQVLQQFLVQLMLGCLDHGFENFNFLYQGTSPPQIAPVQHFTPNFLYWETRKLRSSLVEETDPTQINLSHFKDLCDRIGAPWAAISPALLKTRDLCRTNWPQTLAHLNLPLPIKGKFIEYWAQLHPDFSIQLS